MSRSNDENDNKVDWTFVAPNQIQHLCGVAIVLLSGSWQCPMDINPVVKDVRLSAAEISALIRNGLEFAAKSIVPDSSSMSAETSPKRITPAKNSSGRPVLRLKKIKSTDLV